MPGYPPGYPPPVSGMPPPTQPAAAPATEAPPEGFCQPIEEPGQQQQGQGDEEEEGHVAKRAKLDAE